MFASGNAAATVMAAGLVANGGIDVDNPAAAAMLQMMQHPACWEKGSTIKVELRILVFRRNTRYYNSVWAVD